jgi:hypothetical protein
MRMLSFNHFVLSILLILILSSACSTSEKRLMVDVSKISLSEVKIHRYDIDLFNVKDDQLQRELEALKPAYRFFLDTDLSDPQKLTEMTAYLENPRNLAFQEAVAGLYKNLDILESDLTNAFRHYLYYYPGRTIPRVYTYISGGDYDFPVQYADSVLLIGLDNYLGQDFKPYLSDGLPAYRVARMNSDYILTDCMKLLVDVTHPVQLPGNNLLEQMIEGGKRLYFIDAMIPQTEDRLKIGYSKAQYDWIVAHESNVWAAVIENRLLYTTDGKLIRSFMADGPFTAEFSKGAPSRLGEWLGWQIVRKYMENQPVVTLQEVMNEKDAQKILSMSGYKPEKP